MEKDKTPIVYNGCYGNYLDVRKRQVPELILRAKGERTMASYANSAGVSRAAMCRMLKGQYTPSPKVIAKLTSEEAKPRNGVTYEELMAAAGYYLKEQTENIPQDFMFSKNVNYQNDVTNHICTMLLFNGLSVRQVLKEYPVISGTYTTRCDLMAELKGNKISNWLFKCLDVDMVCLDRSAFLDIIFGQAAMINLDNKTKLTYIVNNECVYQTLKRYEGAVGIRGEVSIAYFDSVEKVIKEEFYLANYKLGDKTKEIYLIKAI